MKLCEIAKSNKVPKGRFQPGGKHLGAGIQATVHAVDRPNAVVKTADVEDETDPYVRFVELVKKHQDNPFFPKIYKSKMIRRGSRKWLLVVVMERLREISDPKLSDAMEQVFARLGFPAGIATTTPTANAWDALMIRSWLEKPENRKELANNTKNPQFKQALTLLEPYFQQFKNDLHSANWMVRLTSVGPQLVMIDPLMPQSGYNYE